MRNKTKTGLSHFQWFLQLKMRAMVNLHSSDMDWLGDFTVTLHMPSPALNFLCLTWCRFIRSLVAFTVVIIARELAVGVNYITSAQKSRLAFTDGWTCEWMDLLVVKLCRCPCECFNGHYQSLPRPLRQAKPQSSAYHCQTSFAHGAYWVQHLTWVNTKKHRHPLRYNWPMQRMLL